MEKAPPPYPQQPYASAPPQPAAYYPPGPPPPAAYYPPGPPPPAAYYPPPQGIAPIYMQGAGAPAQWTTGLCDCCDDTSNCCITCFLPCITFGQIAEIVDRGTNSCGVCGATYGLICALTGCQFIWSCIYRTKMREQYNLAGDSCNDFCVHCCCEPCAICQEYRELKNRGLDPSIGWVGNLARQAFTGVPVPPPVQGGMTRY